MPGTSPRSSASPSSSPRCPRSSGTSTSRWPTRRWCRCSSSPGGPQARQGGAVRRGRRRAVRRLHHLSRAALAEAVRLSPRPVRKTLGRASRPLPEGMRGKSLFAPRLADARGALLRQRPQLLRRPPARGVARLQPGLDPHRRHRADLRRVGGLGSGGRMQHIDLFTWLRGDILVKADKMTMANSLELRVPFLDPEVFAVASRPRSTRRSPAPPPSTRCGARWNRSCPPTC